MPWETTKDLLLLIGGIGGGGVLSYYITRNYIHRPKLTFSLRPAAILHRRDFGNALAMTLRGHAVQNLGIFTLEISLRGHYDISKEHIPEDRKPSLTFPAFRTFDVRTLNNDESRFEIPLGIVAPGNRVIININHLRSNSKAIFQIIGTFEGEVPDLQSYEVEFFPGVIHNVNTETNGLIQRPWKKER